MLLPTKAAIFFIQFFLKFYINKYIYRLSDSEDKTLLAVVYALESGFDFNMLTRRYKEKVSQLLEGGNKIVFRGNPVNNVFRKIIFNYFVNSNSKVVFKWLNMMIRQ